MSSFGIVGPLVIILRKFSQISHDLHSWAQQLVAFWEYDEILTWGIGGQNISLILCTMMTVVWHVCNMLCSKRWVEDCWKITDHFRGVYRIYPDSIKETQRMSTSNRSDLQTLGSQPVTTKPLPRSLLQIRSWICILLRSFGVGPQPHWRIQVYNPSPSYLLILALECWWER